MITMKDAKGPFQKIKPAKVIYVFSYFGSLAGLLQTIRGYKPVSYNQIMCIIR